MSDNNNREVVTPPEGFFHDVSNRVKLILRLLGDQRVSPLIKLLPIGSLLYLVIPDILPGPIDDALIIWLGSTLFVDLCPQDVVEEYMDELNRTIPGQWVEPDEDDVIEGEIRDID